MTKLYLVQAEHWSVPGTRQKIVATAEAADAQARAYVEELWGEHAEDGGDPFEVTDWKASLIGLGRSLLVSMGDQATVDQMADEDILAAMGSDYGPSNLPFVWISEIEAELEEPTAEPEAIKVAHVCTMCGSSSISRDATAWWDVDEQRWGIKTLHDDHSCDACGAAGSDIAEEVPADEVEPEPVHGQVRDIGGSLRVWSAEHSHWMFRGANGKLVY